jgi:hypothetical protein
VIDSLQCKPITAASHHGAALLALLSALALVPSAAPAGAVELAVRIVNASRGEVITPPVVIVHNRGFGLFQVGQPASDELAALAQDGDTAPLAAQLPTLPSVHDFAIGATDIPPGASLTLRVEANGDFRHLTVAGMFATSNDAFMSVHGIEIGGESPIIATATVYDAGAEGNAELCDHIPGPPCNNPFVPNDAGAEGFVTVHAGIHGVGDLAPADFDWQNPGAFVTIRRVE